MRLAIVTVTDKGFGFTKNRRISCTFFAQTFHSKSLIHGNIYITLPYFPVICLPDKVYKGLVEPPKTLIFQRCQLICVTFQTFSRHPLTPEVDSGMTVSTPFPVSPNKIVESPRNTNVPAPADSTKSPNMCLSPGLSPFASRAETPGVVNNSPGWSQGFQQGLDAAARQIHQGSHPRLMRLPGQGAESAARPFVLEAKLESLSRGLERDELGDDSDVIVPVILSLGDKSSVTKEVQLKDIINGTTCTLEGKDYSMPWWKRAVSDNLLIPPPSPPPSPKYQYSRCINHILFTDT